MQLTNLKNDIEVYETFGAFTETHEAIAAFRIQHLRASVVENRIFLTEISDIYNLVKQYFFNAQKENATLANPQKGGFLGLLKGKKAANSYQTNVTFLKKNGKNISILLSSNTGFYGGILKNLFDDFMDYTSKNPSDIAIVGKAGKEFYTERLKTNPLNAPKNISYFDLDDEHPTEEQMDKIIDFAKDYDGINVHYVQFFSVLTQIPYYSNIAGEVGLVGAAEKDLGYIFEPSYEDVLTFFETQILEAVFRQKVYEHQLARYGGKLVAMDDAVTSSKAEVLKLRKRGLRLKKQQLNKKQQEVFSALLGSYEDY